MGFFSRLLYSPECKFCGATNFTKVAQYLDCQMLACKKCGKVLPYYKVPICGVCGKAMRGSAENHNGLVVPLCVNCGHKWDADEKGWIDLRDN